MFTIKNVENEIIINKSKFITNLFSVDSIDEIEKNLEYIRKKYKDATHHCYAYILDNIERFNDDNEPSGTAGMPILDCLKKNDLNHVLCVVTRYFGGIKLGAGNLVRAYSNSVSNALSKTSKLSISSGFLVSIKFSYDKLNIVNNILESFEIIEKKYDEDVTYIVSIDKTTKEKLESITKLCIEKEVMIRQ